MLLGQHSEMKPTVGGTGGEFKSLFYCIGDASRFLAQPRFRETRDGFLGQAYIEYALDYKSTLTQRIHANKGEFLYAS
jgi:hypothetical protein